MIQFKNISWPLLLVAFLFSKISFSATISVQSLCEDSVYAQAHIEANNIKTAGDLTKAFFNQNSDIPHTITEVAITQILNTPSGLDAYEIISDEEMFVYGWCYDVNGYLPDELMNSYKVSNQDHVTWTYGFSHYLRGEWLTYCTPAHTRNWDVICK